MAAERRVRAQGVLPHCASAHRSRPQVIAAARLALLLAIALLLALCGCAGGPPDKPGQEGKKARRSGPNYAFDIEAAGGP